MKKNNVPCSNTGDDNVDNLMLFKSEFGDYLSFHKKDGKIEYL